MTQENLIMLKNFIMKILINYFQYFLIINHGQFMIQNLKSCVCLIYMKQILAYNVNIILSILKETMTNNADPELRLKYFILLSEYFNHL